MKKTILIGLSLFAVANGALAKVVDVAVSGPGSAPVIRASEVTNINFNGTVPANVVGALDADDSTYNRTLTDCSTLSGVGTAVAYDLVNITNTSGNPGSITFSTCPGTGDSFVAVYSAFNPATPLAGCLTANDDFGGGACSTVTFPIAAAQARTVVVTAFDNAATADGLFPYTVTFAGTTGTPAVVPAAPIVPVPGLNTIGLALMALALAFVGMIGFTRRQA